MTAPESKWVADAMRLAHELRCSVPGAVFPADQALLDHLQRQADLMERMGEALVVVAQSGDFTCFNDSHWDTVNAALTAFQESKQ